MVTRAQSARFWTAGASLVPSSMNSVGARAALVTATVAIAFGHQSGITAEAAGVVIMHTSLKRVDQLFQLACRMRRIALQRAVGGMALRIVGMLRTFAGWLPPVAGAVTQEFIDLPRG
jgi:cation transport ATPase